MSIDYRSNAASADERPQPGGKSLELAHQAQARDNKNECSTRGIFDGTEDEIEILRRSGG
jgi:hypothetical protein